MNSRTNFRLQLQREQSIQEQSRDESRALGDPSSSPTTSSSAEMGDLNMCLSSSNAPNMIGAQKLSSGGSISNNNGNNSASGVIVQPKTLPVIISQPIRFNGNRLIHLPPQIIHVQQQQHQQQPGAQRVAHQGDDNNSTNRRNMTLSTSLPPGLNLDQQNQPFVKTPKLTSGDHSNSRAIRMSTPQHFTFMPQQVKVRSNSKHSFSESSPVGTGYVDSPCSASFASAQSELDDVIIDEILSMEEEQQRRRLYDDGIRHTIQNKLATSLSYADDLESLLNAGRTSSYGQRQVSNSAPSASLDIEGLVHDELNREQDVMKDRRKKDVHNMIERRRRYNINDRIKELGSLLPKSCTEEMKLNKGTILQASVEYIFSLRKDQERLFEMQNKQQILQDENRRMLNRIQDLEQQLKANGLPLPVFESYVDVKQKVIKSEPIDEADEAEDCVCKAEKVSVGRQTSSSSFNQHQQSSSHSLDYNNTAMSTHNYGVAPPASQQQQQQQEQHSHMMYYDDNNTVHSQQQHQHHQNYANLPGAQSSQNQNHNQNHHSHSNAARNLQNVAHQQPAQRNYYAVSAGGTTHLHDFMMELSGGGGSADDPSSPHHHLLTSLDPMISDSRLMSSQVSSPDIHWDSATFSPESNSERMDYVAT